MTFACTIALRVLVFDNSKAHHLIFRGLLSFARFFASRDKTDNLNRNVFCSLLRKKNWTFPNFKTFKKFEQSMM